MKGNIYTSQRCPICHGPMSYDPRKANCICPTHNVGATGGFFVRFGRDHFKRFQHIVQAEQHLNHLRAQTGNEALYGKYDPRDWKKSNPLGIRSLGKQWLERKSHTKPPLSETRMHELRTSIDRAVEFWGDINIKVLTGGDLAAFAVAPHGFLGKQDRQLSEKTVFNICCNLQEFVSWACKSLKVEAPQFEGLGYDMVETQPITMQQQVAIVEWIKQNCPEPRIWFAIQALCKNPNVRPGEFCDLRWGHIDIFGEVAYIHKDKNRRRLGRKKPRPKTVFLNSAQVEYLKSQEWGNPDELFMVYTQGRSGVIAGDPIHVKRLNHWFKEGGKAIGVDTTLYAGTKHTTTTGLAQHINRELIRRAGTGHATEAAYEHYQHDHLSDQIRVQKTIDRMTDEARNPAKLRKVK